MNKLTKSILSIVAILTVICLLILFKGITKIEEERAKSHPLNEVLSGENIDSIIFQNGKVEQNGLYKRFTITDQDFIGKIAGVINTATIVEQIDSLSVTKSNYEEKYMTICYKNGKKELVTFYGVGDTLLGTNNKYYKIAYNPSGNEFIAYSRANFFSYDLVDKSGNVAGHVDGGNPFDIDLGEIQEIYSDAWKNTPSILDPSESGSAQDIYSYYWDKTPTILD